jgi:phosphate transport system permease protein
MSRKLFFDRATTAFVYLCALMVVTPLLFIIALVTIKGLPNLSPGFFSNTLEGVDPSAPASAGGAAHAIVGTLVQVSLATLISMPFGVLTAVYLNEIKGRMAGVIRLIVDAMSGIPSVVAGLFIFSIWVVKAHQGFSGLAASLALSVLMLPTVARTTEEMLKLVPEGLREASLALGSPQWRTARYVVLPTARVGIVTAMILGIARIAGETAPLLMTGFGNDQVIAGKSFSEPQSALPLFIYQQVTNSQGAAVDRAWTAAFVLIALVLILFTLARLIGRPASQRT